MRRIPSASIFFLPLSLAVAACDGGSPEPTGSGGSGGGGTTSSTTAGSEPEHHRPAAVACTGDRPPGSIGIGPDGECAADEECTDGVNGRCVQDLGLPTYCSYDECAEDADCGGSRVCECRNPAKHDANVCVHGNCLVDADCGEGGYCSPSAVTLSPYCTEGIPVGSFGYFCHTPQDECVDDADCPDGDFMGGCLFDVDEMRWACRDILCVN